jgi:hypothetical protein
LELRTGRKTAGLTGGGIAAASNMAVLCTLGGECLDKTTIVGGGTPKTAVLTPRAYTAFFIPEPVTAIAPLAMRAAVAAGFSLTITPRALPCASCPALAPTLPRRACAIDLPQIIDASQVS